MRIGEVALLAAVLLFGFTTKLIAQRGGPPRTAKASAPIDLTGYWTALITDDWEYRMVTPAKGEIQFIPLNDAARKIANEWDPLADEQRGLQCKGYGAPAVMRLPTRLHITWEDDNTLKVETDFGMQTRLFHFVPQPAHLTQERTWQGTSIAEWETGPSMTTGPGLSPEQLQEAQLQTGAAAPNLDASATARLGLSGVLKVVTTNLRAGYLRKNGVPYSENAGLTEWFNPMEDKGVRYLAVQTQVVDPMYLTVPFFRTLHFKKEADGSKWHPTPCSAK